MEEWKDIGGYEGLYQVSNIGRIRSVDRKYECVWKNKNTVRNIKGKIIKPNVQNSGYYIVWLSKHGKSKAFSLHRLVAETFIKNPNNLEQVNHKDGNKLNNSVDNLEWCSRSYNARHSFYVLKRGHESRKVMCIETKQIYKSANEAAKANNCNKNGITRCCGGLRKTYLKLHWKYMEEEI